MRRGHPYCRRRTARRCLRHEEADLFNDKWVISTPTDEMDPEKVKFIEDAWTKAGAKDQSDVAPNFTMLYLRFRSAICRTFLPTHW